MRKNEKLGVTISLINKVKISEIKYKTIADFLIEMGSNYVVISGIIFLLTV